MAAMGTDEQVECGLLVEDRRVKEQFGISSRVSNGKDYFLIVFQLDFRKVFNCGFMGKWRIN
jgi:hypothetical protein